MTESKDIANYYIDRFRKTINFCNKALAVAFLILIVNWLFSIEPGYQVVVEARQSYKSQLRETEKQLNYYIHQYYRFYNRNAVDYEAYIYNLRMQDTLRKSITNSQMIGADYAYLEDSLDLVEEAIHQYRGDSINRSMIVLLKDSILHVKQKRIELDQAKTASLNENLKDYDWTSLIRFIFIVGGNPKNGSLYLMGLITLILIFGVISKRISLHYLAKGLRIYKLDSSLGINSYQDFSIPSPFWLSPLPVSKKRSKKNKEEDKDFNITRNDLSNILGFNSTNKFTYLTIFLLLCLLALQLRLLYICIHANTPIHFDFSFTIGSILCLLAIAQVLIWIYPNAIEDQFNYESVPNPISRRLFITYGVVTLVAVILLRSRNEIAKFYGLNAKRYFKKRKDTEINKSKIVNHEGLYFRPPNPRDNKRRKIIYFFDNKRCSHVLGLVVNMAQLNIFRKKLISINNADFSPQNGYRFNQNHYSWHTEYYILSLLKQGQPKKANSFIFEQVTSNSIEVLSNYRLLDLAAKMFIRLDKTNTYLNNFLNYLNQRLNNPDDYFSNDLILRERFYKWSDKKWVDKIKIKDFVVYNKTKF